MSLASVSNTALTALSAVEMAVGVIAHNLANAQTDGFKASRTIFSAGPIRSYSPGSGPNGRSGGTNPIQVGTGVFPAAVEIDFRQGSLLLSADPLDMAIQGDGFFMVQGSDGAPLFTRHGDFHANADGEIVSATGHRVLGFPVDENFQVNRTDLAPLTLPSAGSTSGASLVGISVDQDGRMRGRFSDGLMRDLGQVAVARFANPSGLEQRGENLFATGSNSGLPVIAGPNEARVTAGVRELSNVSIGQELIDLTAASIMFRANAQVFHVADEMFDVLLNLRRR